MGGYSFAARRRSKLAFVPHRLLIDRPLLYAFLGVFLLALVGQYEGTNRLLIAGYIGLVFAAGYLLKVSMIAVGLPLGVVWLSFLWREFGVETSPTMLSRWANRRLWRRAIYMALLMLIPFTAVFIVWSVRRTGNSCLATAGDFLGGDLLVFATPQGLSLLDRMLDAFLAYAGNFKLALSLFALLTLALALASRRTLPVILSAVIFAAVYVLALFYGYAFCLGGIDTTYLESFQRFIRLPIRVGHFMSFLLAGLAVLYFLGRNRTPGERILRRPAGRISLIGIVVLGLVWQVHQIDRSVAAVGDRKSTYPEVAAVHRTMAAHSERLRAILRARKLVGAPGYMIAQGTYGVEYDAANYYAIQTRRGGKYFHYVLRRPFSFRPAHIEQLATASFIWPVRMDSATLDFLAPRVRDSRCRERLTNYFLIRNSTGGFDCLLK